MEPGAQHSLPLFGFFGGYATSFRKHLVLDNILNPLIAAKYLHASELGFLPRSSDMRTAVPCEL